MARIVVTGGSGASGRVVVRELLGRGHEVINIDRVSSTDGGAGFREVDLTEFGDTLAAMVGSEAVVHLAANPEPDFDDYTGFQRFHNNTLSTFNVFNAAVSLGIRRVVWASSETVLGFPFETNRPLRIPVTEDDPIQPQNCYAISKAACEEVARHFARLHGMTFVGLRLSNILYESGHRDLYSKIPGYWDDIESRKFNLWGYIDSRDVARCVAIALRAPIEGAQTYIIAARDSIMNRPSAELVAAAFPGVDVDPQLGDFDALISSAKAERDFGFAPAYSWRDVIADR